MDVNEVEDLLYIWVISSPNTWPDSCLIAEYCISKWHQESIRGRNFTQLHSEMEETRSIDIILLAMHAWAIKELELNVKEESEGQFESNSFHACLQYSVRVCYRKKFNP